VESECFIYICDGSIEGLLSCIYEAYYSKENVYDIIHDADFQKNFIYTYRNIPVSYENAQKVAYSIRTKISRHAFDNMVNAWLSELPLCGHYILEYVRLGYANGSAIHQMLTHEVVSFIEGANLKILKEVHRFLGICRFSKMQDSTYLCTISPDHNILSLLANHFASRMPNEKLIIYDEKRKNAVLSDNGEWIIANNVTMKNTAFSEDEFVFRSMWQRYFEAIAIKERTNKKLQRSFIPTRYWKNVTELKDENF